MLLAHDSKNHTWHSVEEFYLHISFFHNMLQHTYEYKSNRSSWSRGSVPSSHARGQRFEPRRRQYFKLLLDPGDFSLQPQRNPYPTLTPPSCWVRHVRSIGGPQYGLAACAITLNYCTYTNHVGVSPRALYCVVDTSYGLGRSLGHCRPALPKGRKYQMVKTQTESHDRRPIVWTNRWQIWVSFSFEVCRGTAGIYHADPWGFSEAL